MMVGNEAVRPQTYGKTQLPSPTGAPMVEHRNVFLMCFLPSSYSDLPTNWYGQVSRTRWGDGEKYHDDFTVFSGRGWLWPTPYRTNSILYAQKTLLLLDLLLVSSAQILCTDGRRMNVIMGCCFNTVGFLQGFVVYVVLMSISYI